MRSQTWQNITWEHSLIIHEPKDVVCQDYMLLFVTGGRNGRPPGNGDHAMGFALAKMTGARVAMLYQVPNQPLFDNRYEDDLITETWLRYLESGDDSWPLLFPMVKSAVKAMDTLEAVANERWQTKLNGFVITGASKRGWTSWLTPVVDKRVVATAPMVIDVLNFRPQMKHQLDVWGTYSDQIHDYSSKGLIKQDDESPREMKLRLMMDPYTYRSVLKLPKLLVNGTNDQYWVVDAMKLYWPDLEGPKFVLQVPNAGHGLGGGGDRVGATVAAFFRHVVQGRELPKISWKALEDDSNFGLQLDVEPNPRQVTFWRAHSSSGDFRESRWSSVPMDKKREWICGPGCEARSRRARRLFWRNGIRSRRSVLLVVDPHSAPLRNPTYLTGPDRNRAACFGGPEGPKAIVSPSHAAFLPIAPGLRRCAPFGWPSMLVPRDTGVCAKNWDNSPNRNTDNKEDVQS